MPGGAPIPECLATSGDECQPVQLVVLCDDNGPFLRRYIVNCDNGTILGVVDTLLDGVTGYVPVGTVGTCDEVGDEIAAREMCDLGTAPETPFLRTQVVNNAGVVVATVDTLPDGLTPYVVTGPIDFDCSCVTVEWVQRRVHLIGVNTWSRPVDTREVIVKCRALDAAGSVTIDDGATVTPMFVGDEERWEAPGGDVFSGTFDVDLAGAGDVVTILWTELA